MIVVGIGLAVDFKGWGFETLINWYFGIAGTSGIADANVNFDGLTALCWFVGGREVWIGIRGRVAHCLVFPPDSEF